MRDQLGISWLVLLWILRVKIGLVQDSRAFRCYTLRIDFVWNICYTSLSNFLNLIHASLPRALLVQTSPQATLEKLTRLNFSPSPALNPPSSPFLEFVRVTSWTSEPISCQPFKTESLPSPVEARNPAKTLYIIVYFFVVINCFSVHIVVFLIQNCDLLILSQAHFCC